jgi:hypothetical protein
MKAAQVLSALKQAVESAHVAATPRAWDSIAYTEQRAAGGQWQRPSRNSQ